MVRKPSEYIDSTKHMEYLGDCIKSKCIDRGYHLLDRYDNDPDNDSSKSNDRDDYNDSRS